jgi:integrase
MARTTKELTDPAIRNVKPDAIKPKYMFDGKGLYLHIPPLQLRQDGKPKPVSKWWRFKYRFGGKTNLLSFGTYPEVSLANARDKRDIAREQVAAGIDPGAVRKAQKEQAVKVALTFETVAREWHEKHKDVWSTRHTDDVMGKLKHDVFPVIGNIAISLVKTAECLKLIKKIEARGALETAHRTRQILVAICGYALANEYTETNVAALTKGAIAPVRKVKHHPAITDPKELAGLLKAIDTYPASFLVKSAMFFGAYTAVRPGELRKAEWSEIDFDAEQWNIPEEKMKSKLPHIVPLSRQTLTILKELKPLTGTSRYIFTNGRSSTKPMSENGVTAALAYLGFKGKHSGQGWRATFRTIGDEVLQFRPDFIEHQLAHAVRDPNGRAYNRTAYLAERRKMMQAWADCLDGLKSGGR